MLSAQQLVGLLAERDRRLVVAALILRASTVEELVTATGLDTRTVVDALERLRTAELVIEGSDGTWLVLEESFKAAARSRPDERSSEHDDQPDEHRLVLERSIVDGRIVNFPTKRSKRLIVLERLAQEFEPGVRYPEREVDRILRSFDDDTAMLRRWLIDESFLDRADGEYWRAGGRVDT